MRKGDVWLINLDPTIGAEIKKTRPVVIVSEDSIGVLPLKVVVPVTDWKDRYVIAPWMVRLDPDVQNRLDKTSAAAAFRCVLSRRNDLSARSGRSRARA
jgi:mRNA interferase MazF